MKIKRFNESYNLKQYITCIIIYEYKFGLAGTFERKSDKDDWLLNIFNNSFIKWNEENLKPTYDTELNPNGQYIFTNVNEAIAWHEDEMGSYIFNIVSEEDPNKKFEFVCMVQDDIGGYHDGIFETKKELDTWLIDLVYNECELYNKPKDATEAKNIYEAETNGEVYYGKTRMISNVKLKYGVELLRSKEIYNI